MRSIHSSLADEIGKSLDDSDKQEVKEQLDSTRKWLDSKKGKSATEEDFSDRKKELEKIWNPLVSKAYRGGNGDEGGEDEGGGTPPEDTGPDEL